MSISDTMAAFAAEIDEDLTVGTAGSYGGLIGERIAFVRDEAESLCMILGIPTPLSADFISPYRQTDRPVEERWSEWLQVYGPTMDKTNPTPSLVDFLNSMLKVETQPDHIIRQVTADLAELQAAAE